MPQSGFGWLKSRGLTNSDSETIEGIAAGLERNIESKALCTSKKCNPKTGKGSRVDYVRKYVSLNTTDCPDCGNSLFWDKSKRRKKE